MLYGVSTQGPACRPRIEICWLVRAMVHGCDIPIDQPEVFQRAVARSAKMLTSLGVEIIPVASNFRQLDEHWFHSHAALVASSLWLFHQSYSSGLIASSKPYNDLRLPWGSNPVTDWLLGGFVPNYSRRR